MAKKPIFKMAAAAILNFKNFNFWSRDCHWVHYLLLCTKFYQNRMIFTARCDASAVYAVKQCLSVCLSVRPSVHPSVTFVDYVKTNKHIFKIFSPSGGDTILVFPSQRGCRYSDGNPPKGGVECKGGMIKCRFFHKYLAVSQKW